MAKWIRVVEEDEVREERITMEIVVDAYGELERALGWHCYLKDILPFPFRAKCTSPCVTSPLQVGDEVEVTGMPSERDCEHEMLVNINWNSQTLAVPLSQLTPIKVDQDSKEAIADWHYWVGRGYRF